MSPIEIIRPGNSLRLDPEHSGFAHGFGLFETIRLRNGCIELWEAHWQRLVRSAANLGIPCPWQEAEALEAVRSLTKGTASDAMIKVSLLKENMSSRLLVYSRPVSDTPVEVGLLTTSAGCINENSPLIGLKTHNYIENMLVLEESRRAGCFDGLRLNSQGYITEGAISNIFLLKDGVLCTPGLECGLLPGVVRCAILEAVEVKQGNYLPEDLLAAEAVFLTNSAVGLLPVDWLQSGDGKHRIPSREHARFKELLSIVVNRIAGTTVKVS